MKPAALLVNNHPYTFFTRRGRHLLPTSELDIHMVTRNNLYGGVTGLTAAPLAHVSVCDADDEAEWRAVCNWTLEAYPVSRVVAVHERAVLLAAELRSAHGLAGMDHATALRFRDKVLMKEAVRAAGAATVPEFAALDSPDQLDALHWAPGMRRVIKNRTELAAKDLYVVDSPQSARAVAARLDLSGGRYEIEEYVEGDIYHCDSVVQDGQVRFSSVGVYLTNPSQYAAGGVFGTVLLTGGDVVERIRPVNERVIAALGMTEGTTHFEFFRTPGDDLVFCEIAGRAPGGVIPPVIEWQYGFNIVEADIRLQTGLPVSLPGAADAATAPGALHGFVAFYPGGPAERGIAEDLHAGLGVVEHIRHRGAGDGRGGVRHSTDFQDSYVVRGRDRDDLMGRIAAVRHAYWR
ncbi:ATP-grasp domain-containing protein [Streptomyces sp. NRRL F-5123]|uniref:ATP-grasp domain-containing protein n=1 Tax=Streptomyces sp. NRRL F-5123 TaxID=1463856 RepID=UPI0006949B0D|nr:hypothetical protein [Streptomyces sp. NRRL F-5123]